MPLLPGQRQRLILDRLRHDGAVQTTQLALQLGTSTVTVRRDLDAMIRRGLARRVYGGAVATLAHLTDAPNQPPPPRRQRERNKPTIESPTPRASQQMPTPRVVPLPGQAADTDLANQHFRRAQWLLALAESRLRRNEYEDAREWRSLAELHIRLAEYVRSSWSATPEVAEHEVQQP
jgi:DNA-binding transcriptional MocR family regulator